MLHRCSEVPPSILGDAWLIVPQVPASCLSLSRPGGGLYRTHLNCPQHMALTMFLSPPRKLSLRSNLPAPLSFSSSVFVVELVAHTFSTRGSLLSELCGKGLLVGGMWGVFFSQITNSSPCLMPSLWTARNPMTNAC